MWKTCNNFSEYLAFVSWSWTQEIEWCQDLLSIPKPSCIAPCVWRRYYCTPRLASLQKRLGFCSNLSDWSVIALFACVRLFGSWKAGRLETSPLWGASINQLCWRPDGPGAESVIQELQKIESACRTLKNLAEERDLGVWQKRVDDAWSPGLKHGMAVPLFSRHHFGCGKPKRADQAIVRFLFSLVVPQPTKVVAAHTHSLHVHRHTWTLVHRRTPAHEMAFQYLFAPFVLWSRTPNRGTSCNAKDNHQLAKTSSQQQQKDWRTKSTDRRPEYNFSKV